MSDATLHDNFIIQSVASGRSFSDIAADLGLSIETIEARVRILTGSSEGPKSKPRKSPDVKNNCKMWLPHEEDTMFQMYMLGEPLPNIAKELDRTLKGVALRFATPKFRTWDQYAEMYKPTCNDTEPLAAPRSPSPDTDKEKEKPHEDLIVWGKEMEGKLENSDSPFLSIVTIILSGVAIGISLLALRK
jgi:hypothetical protein